MMFKFITKQSVVCLLTLFLSMALEPQTIRAAEFRVTPLPDPYWPDFIFVSGYLAPGDDDRFFELAKNIKKKVIVTFKSHGGNLAAGLGIGKIIREKAFATAVPAQFDCASACALAWLGGVRRYMHEGSRIGFHAAYTADGKFRRETGLGNALVGAYLTKLGLSESVVIYVTRRGPDEELQWLTINDALEKGINVRTPSTTESPSLEQVATALASVFVLSERCGITWPDASLREMVAKHGYNLDDFMPTGRHGELMTNKIREALQLVTDLGSDQGCKKLLGPIHSTLPEAPALMKPAVRE